MSIKNLYCRTFQGAFSIINKLIPDYKQDVLSGEGKLYEIPALLKERGLNHPLIVSGERVSKTEFFNTFVSKITGQYSIYNSVKSDPGITQINQMADFYRKNNCDSIIAIGGGSNLDAAKAMGALIVRPQKTLQELGGLLKVRKKLPFFVAVPTTAGTGSECTIASVVTDDSINRKYSVGDPVLLPDVAVLDPVLTVTLPANLTAYTGMDALTHAVESFLNTSYHKKNTRAQALSAIKDIFEYLPKAFENGSDILARQKMLHSSYMAGLSFTTAAVGYVHAVAHAVGGLYQVQHGLANSIILPRMLERYRPKIDLQLAELAELIGAASPDADTQAKASAFIEAVYKLNKKMGLPQCLPQIKEEDASKMAVWADKEANPLYPVPVILNRKDLEEFILSLKN
jgi:alcohol dehydrogenase class IV